MSRGISCDTRALVSDAQLIFSLSSPNCPHAGEPLETFKHPDRAVYILGSEDTGLPESVVQVCSFVFLSGGIAVTVPIPVPITNPIPMTITITMAMAMAMAMSIPRSQPSVARFE